MGKDIIIGITGTFGAGKGTVVEYLKEKKGFEHYSATGFIVKEIKKRKMEVNRDNMVVVANDLRDKHGSGYIAQSLYQQALKERGNCIIESLRTPGEIETLKKKGGFYMLAVDAEPKIRYERIKKRGGSKDGVSYDQFIGGEKLEMESDDPTKQNIGKCIQMADYRVDNSGTREELYRQVDEVLEKIEV